jgi:hypothetical protein
MPAVKFFESLDLEKNSSFRDGNLLTRASSQEAARFMLAGVLLNQNPQVLEG